MKGDQSAVMGIKSLFELAEVSVSPNQNPFPEESAAF